jgi:hypothetical protein
MIDFGNRNTGFARACAIMSGVAIAIVTTAKADSSTRRDRCPSYPSAVACRGVQSTPAGAQQWAPNYRRKSSPSGQTRR